MGQERIRGSRRSRKEEEEASISNLNNIQLLESPSVTVQGKGSVQKNPCGCLHVAKESMVVRCSQFPRDGRVQWSLSQKVPWKEDKARQIFLGGLELPGSLTDKSWLGGWIRVDGGATKFPASLFVSCKRPGWLSRLGTPCPGWPKRGNQIVK